MTQDTPAVSVLKNAAKIEFGVLPAGDTSFRALSMLFARNRQYARMPLGRIVDLFDALRDQRNYCALQNKRLVGAVLWKEISAELARTCVEAGRMPTTAELAKNPGTGGVVTTAFIAPSPALVRRFWDSYAKRHVGKVVLLERHTPDKPPRFIWVDKEGKVRGRAV